MFENIACVIVTYSNRAEFVLQTVANARIAGLSRFIIVDNNSSIESKCILDSIPDVKIISFNKNKGAGFGFGVGILEAMRMNDISHILLLDDDNLIEKDCVVNLMDFWNVHKNAGLFCLRYFDKDFLTKTDKELEINNLKKYILNENSYCYFSLDKLFSMLKAKLVSRKKNHKAFYETVAGAYGGFFFHKSLMLKNELPDASYFVYFCDIKFTYKIWKNGTNLYLVPDCLITDLERSLANSEVKSYFKVSQVLENWHSQNETKFFYGFRNRVRLEKELLITNEWKYRLNKSLFKSIILPVLSVIYWLKFKNVERINLLKVAIKEGEWL